MKFVTDKINTGKGKSFDDLIKDFISKKEVKTASANVQTKKANLDNFGDKKAEPFGAKKDDKEVEKKDEVEVEAKTETEKKEVEASDKGNVVKDEEGASSGQLEVEPLHQEGESTPTPHKDGDKKEASADKGDKCKDECPSTGQPEWEGKNTNDPDAGKHREGDGDQKAAAAKSSTKKAECEAEESEDEKQEDEKECSAKSETKFIRIANLNDKSKKWLAEYWKNLYPAEYVDAMLSDK